MCLCDVCVVCACVGEWVWLCAYVGGWVVMLCAVERSPTGVPSAYRTELSRISW